MSQKNAATGVRNVVLVHGGFVDGSGWEGVYRALTKRGYNVSIVQNPTLSLADDVAVTKRTLAAQAGPRASWDIRTAVSSSPKRARTGGSQGLCMWRRRAGHRRVGRVTHSESSCWGAGAPDSPAAGWIPFPRQGEIRRVVRRRC